MQCQVTESAGQCEICEIRFSRKENRVRHRTLHVAKNIFLEAKERTECCYHNLLTKCTRLDLLKRPFPCLVCAKKYEQDVTRPFFHCLTIQRPYRCIVCGRTFAEIDAIRQHLKSHGSDKNFRYKRNRMKKNFSHPVICSYYKMTAKRMYDVSCFRQGLIGLDGKRNKLASQYNSSQCTEHSRFKKKAFNEKNQLEYKSLRGCRTANQGRLEYESTFNVSKLQKSIPPGSFPDHKMSGLPSQPGANQKCNIVTPKPAAASSEVDVQFFKNAPQTIKCEHCLKGFKRMCALKSHLNYCKGSSSKNKSEMQEEVVEICGDSDIYRCKICGREYLYIRSLKHHMKICHASCTVTTKLVATRSYSCKICRNTYSHVTSLRRHFKKSHPHNIFDDSVCYNDLSKSKNMARKTGINLFGDSAGKQGKFYCDICMKTLQDKRFAKIHMMRHHSQRIYSCRVCKKRFMNSEVYENHCLTHDENFFCKICRKSVRKEYSKHMEAHKREDDYIIENILVRISKGPTRQYGCCICKRVFTRLSYLKLHVSRTHRDQVKF